ncbi:MAG: glycosyltransferase [Saprospiraceae bacterium]|nr:glycosyltransferase [Saprospiraceae bacterium]
MIWLAYFSVFIFVLYLVIILIFILHWNKTPLFKVNPDRIPSTQISVIIPVRNEADNILACVESLLSQSYPPELYEIIVVDDQSYDETPDILEKIEDPRLKYMRLGVERKTTITGSKKKALSYGVNHAKGKLIITTDGDCVLPSNWILSFAQYYELHKPKLIVGPVRLLLGKGFFHIFQNLDLMSSFLVHTAGISSRLSFLCSGANLSYERDSFIQINPYENNLHIHSGDDVFLIQKFKTEFPNQIKVLKSHDAICQTQSEPTLKSFISQRLRWSTKMKHTSDLRSVLLASLIWLQKILPWVLLSFSILLDNITTLYISLGIILTQFILDFVLLHKATSFFQKTKLLWYFIPVELMHSIYYLFVGILSWFPIKIEWKDRRIS